MIKKQLLLFLIILSSLAGYSQTITPQWKALVNGVSEFHAGNKVPTAGYDSLMYMRFQRLVFKDKSDSITARGYVTHTALKDSISNHPIVNIYNSDGDLTSDRFVHVGSHALGIYDTSFGTGFGLSTANIGMFATDVISNNVANLIINGSNAVLGYSLGSGAQNVLRIDTGGYTVIDGIKSRGLVYRFPYEANYVDESLTSKRYVDSIANLKKNSEGIIGDIYNQSTWANLSDFTDISSGASIVSNQIAFTGGANDYTHRLALNPASCLDIYRFKATFKVNEKSATSFGIGISQFGYNATNKTSLTASFDCTNTGTSGLLKLTGGVNNVPSTAIVTSATSLSFSVGDEIEMILDRSDYLINFMVRNITTGSAYVTLTYSYPFGGTSQRPNTNNFSIINEGGTFTMESMYISSQDVKNTPLAIVGDSKLYSLKATQGYFRLGDRLGKRYSNVFMSSGSGDCVTDVLAKIQEIINAQPKTVLLSIGRNDLNNGVSLSTVMLNYASVVSQLKAAGINVVHGLPMYESAATVNQQAFVDSLKARYPTSYIDWWALSSNTPGFLDADGIHPSDFGYKELELFTVASGKITGGDKLLNYDLSEGTKFVSSAGLYGGQSINGGLNSSENLTLFSTANATKGLIKFGTGSNGSGLASAWNETSNYWGFGVNNSTARVTIGGGGSANSWGVNGIGLKISAGTYTDLTGTGTISGLHPHTIAIPTINTTTVGTTITNASTLYLAGPPTAGANTSITNPYTLYVSTGNTKIGTVTNGSWQGTSVAAGFGGTGQSTYTIGDILAATASTTLGKLADVATGNALISGGVGAAPSYGKIGLTTHVSGTLPAANGGLNTTTTPTTNQIPIATGSTTYAPTTISGDLTNALGVFTIGANKVTYAKMQSVTTNKLLGSGSGTAVDEITLGTNLSFSGTTLNVASSTDNILSKTADYTIVSGDFVAGKKTTLDLYVDATSGNVTITLPSAATFAGYTIYITKTDASANTITVNTLLGGNSITSQYQVKQCNSNATSWYNH